MEIIQDMMEFILEVVEVVHPKMVLEEIMELILEVVEMG